MSEIEILRNALDELVHSIEDYTDDYARMESACAAAKLLLPDYKSKDGE